MLKKTALITGSAKRIGRAIALSFAEKGWSVALHYHTSEDDVLSLKTEIQKGGGEAQYFQADLSCPTQREELVKSITQNLGPLSCLVNNASIFEPDSLYNFNLNPAMIINLEACLHLSQLFAKQAICDGVIINLLDQRVLRPRPGFLSYSLSKAGLYEATKLLAQELSPHIRVMGIGPGPTLPSQRQKQSHFENQVKKTLLQRPTSLEDITRCVHFILETKSLTGQMITLDSGQHLSETQDEE